MKKKILSMVMAGAMALSVCSISQAAEITKDTTSGKYAAPEVKAEGAYEAPAIKVTLSDTSSKKIAINPYGLTTTSVATVSGDAAKEPLVNKVETIVNDSEVALAVNATVKGTPAGKASLATADVKSTETKNAIFAYLQVDQVAAADFAAKTYDAKGGNQVIFAAGKETVKKAIVTLADSSDADKSKAAYKICGSVAANPTAMWTTDDKVDFSIIFDFEPRVIAKTTP